MNDDPRCCGSGTCIIDPEGVCWCGQRWDGQAMRPQSVPVAAPVGDGGKTPAVQPSRHSLRDDAHED